MNSEERKRSVDESDSFLLLEHLRVLLVEDEPDTADLFSFIFERVGAEVKIAISVREALEILEYYEPDIMVSNMLLPDGDGCTLLQEAKVRLEARGREVPAIAVTVMARETDRIRAINAGFQRHVSKPVEPDKLVAVVAHLTGRKKLKKEIEPSL